MQKRIVVIGHTAVDRVYRVMAFPPKPTKVSALEHIEAGGGSAANAAAAAARLGGAVELWSRVGGDEAGHNVRRWLEDAGVDTSHVLVHEGARTPTAAVIVDDGGERLVISEADHEMPMSPEWLPLANIASASGVLSDLSWLEGTSAAFLEARAKGVPTVLDVDLGAAPLLPQILHLADYVIASFPAFERFFPEEDREARLAWLIAAGVRHAGVTLGAKGYVWRRAGGGAGQQGAFSVDVVDTTGAGDAFHGAFTLALSRGCGDEECAIIGSAVAALCCTRLGARAGLPTASELDRFLRDRTGRGLPADWLAAVP